MVPASVVRLSGAVDERGKNSTGQAKMLWRSAFERSIGKAYSTVQYSTRNTEERSTIINNAKHATQQLSFRLSHQMPAAAVVQPLLSKELNKLSMLGRPTTLSHPLPVTYFDCHA